MLDTVMKSKPLVIEQLVDEVTASEKAKGWHDVPHKARSAN